MHGATRALLDADADVFLHQSLSTPCFNALAACEGIWLTDVEGRRIMDFHGNSVHQVGYRPSARDGRGAERSSTRCRSRRAASPTRRRWQLAQRLAALAPDPLGKVLFAPGGTLAIGMALKLARARDRPPQDAVAVGFASTARRSTRSRSAAKRCSARAWGRCCPAPSMRRRAIPRACRFGCGGALQRALRRIPRLRARARKRTSARSIIETIRSTDVQIPPPAYYRIVRDACDRHGALLILDEMPICLGRTGRMFAFEHYGIVPDMVVLGKGLGGAVFPMAALIARRDLDIAADRALGHYTHEKSSVGCAAALATLEVIEHERLLERAARWARTRSSGCARLQARAIR